MAASFCFSREFFFRLRSFRQRLTDLEPRPIGSDPAIVSAKGLVWGELGRGALERRAALQEPVDRAQVVDEGRLRGRIVEGERLEPAPVALRPGIAWRFAQADCERQARAAPSGRTP
jgi:hypothetical protein